MVRPWKNKKGKRRNAHPEREREMKNGKKKEKGGSAPELIYTYAKESPGCIGFSIAIQPAGACGAYATCFYWPNKLDIPSFIPEKSLSSCTSPLASIETQKQRPLSVRPSMKKMGSALMIGSQARSHERDAYNNSYITSTRWCASPAVAAAAFEKKVIDKEDHWGWRYIPAYGFEPC